MKHAIDSIKPSSIMVVPDGGSVASGKSGRTFPVSLALLDKDGVIVAANAEWHRSASIGALLGSALDVGSNYLDGCLHPANGNEGDTIQSLSNGLRQVLDHTIEELTLEYSLAQPDGQRWFRMTLSQMAPEPISEAAIVLVDITERHHNEKAIRDMTENIADIVFNYDPVSNRLLYANSVFERIWGRSLESVYQNPLTYLDGIHPEDQPAARHAFEQQLAGEETETEFRVVRPDGTIRWVLEHAVPIQGDEKYGRRIVGTMRDITEHKEMEAQYLRAQRLESIGTLAGGIAHDFKNLLSPIMMGIDALRGCCSDLDESATRIIRSMESSARRGCELADQILSFARGSETARTRISLETIIREVDSIIRATLPKDITIETHVPPRLWPILGDATQINQVILNLCLNARDAMPNGGILSIELKNQTFQATECPTGYRSKPGPHVVIQVRDTGCGIPLEIQDRIFDPFFSTKAPGKGTGLGLASVQSIVHSHGGFVLCESEPQKGTTFTVCIPADCARIAPSAVEENASPPMGNGELILVIDDEEDICTIARETLIRCGYRVFTALNGLEAIELYKRHSGDIAVVLTDMAMPQLDGCATISKLRAINPAVRIIATSGHTGALGAKRAKALNVHHFIQKPYRSATILKALRAALSDER